MEGCPPGAAPAPAATGPSSVGTSNPGPAGPSRGPSSASPGGARILRPQASSTGTIRIQDATVVGTANDFLPETAGWVLGAVAVLAYGLAQLNTARQRRASGLYGKPFSLIVLQVAGLALVTFAAVWYCNQDRGVPYAIVILIVFLIFWSFIAARTRFGRHVYAVGGNAEASRRAGINVDRVRIAVFMISGFMAGGGGIMPPPRPRSVATTPVTNCSPRCCQVPKWRRGHTRSRCRTMGSRASRSTSSARPICAMSSRAR